MTLCVCGHYKSNHATWRGWEHCTIGHPPSSAWPEPCQCERFVKAGPEVKAWLPFGKGRA